MITRIFILLVLAIGTMRLHAADVRIENEFKLTVPDDKGDEVWSYLKKKYENGENLFLKKFDPGFHTEISREIFHDVYFDTPALDLLKRESGVRRRDRFFPDNPSHKKHGRSLIQIKLSRFDDSDLNRSEIKFDVKKNMKVGKNNKNGPRDLIRKKKQRLEFDLQIQKLGLKSGRLKQVLYLKQIRRRAYISNEEGPFATITLDEVEAKAGNRKAKFTEVELELNENLYTDADEKKRTAMEKVNDILLNDLQEKFDFIKVDQTPKYNKAAQVLGISIPK